MLPAFCTMLGTKAPLRYLSSEGIEPAAAPLGIRVASIELLTEAQRPAMSFLDEEPTPAPVTIAPVRLTHSGALRRMLSQTRFGPLDLLIIDLAPGLEELYRMMRLLTPTGVILVTHTSGSAAIAIRHALDMNKEIARADHRCDREHGGVRMRQLPLGAAPVSAGRGRARSRVRPIFRSSRGCHSIRASRSRRIAARFLSATLPIRRSESN